MQGPVPKTQRPDPSQIQKMTILYIFVGSALVGLNAVGHLDESLPKRAVQAKRQCETGETIRSEEKLQEVVAFTGAANH